MLRCSPAAAATSARPLVRIASGRRLAAVRRQRATTTTIMAASSSTAAAAAPWGDDAEQQEEEEVTLRRFKGSGTTETTTARGRRAGGAVVAGLADTVWDQAALRLGEFPKLSESINVNVAVVGGGVAGCTAAYLLSKSGSNKRVALLEARVVGGGNAGRGLGEMSTWHASAGGLGGLERGFSATAEQLRRVVASNREAIAFVEATVAAERIACDFQRVDTVVLPRDAGAPGAQAGARAAAEQALRRELALCRAAGIDGAELVELPLGGGGGGGGGMMPALRLPLAGARLNPLAYARGLAKAIVAAGGQVYEDTRVRRLHPRGRRLTILDGGGAGGSGEVHVGVRDGWVLATGAPITSSVVDSAAHVLALHAKQHVVRRHVVALKVPRFNRPLAAGGGGLAGVPAVAGGASAADQQQEQEQGQVQEQEQERPGSAAAEAAAGGARSSSPVAGSGGGRRSPGPGPPPPGPRSPLFFDLGAAPQQQHAALVVPGNAGGAARGLHDVLLVAGEARDQGRRPADGEASASSLPPLKRLEAYARRLWPSAGELLGANSFQAFQASDDLPIAGRDPTLTARGGCAVYVATGDCGRLLTSGTIAGNVVASELLGWRAGALYGGLYDPKRRLQRNTSLGLLPDAVASWSPRYFANTIASALELVTPLPRFASAAARDIDTLPRGSGRVVNSGLRKVAVHKRDDGSVTRLSAVCPHLGCLVSWSPEDNEWHCPCHGSAFTAEGRLLCGPATIDMTKLDES